LVALAAGSAVPSSLAATPQEVQTAIENAQKYLLAHRNKDGNWEASPKPVVGDKGVTALTGVQWGGLTSIATYALIASGEDYRGEMKEAVKFLLHANIISTYGVGLSSQITLFVPEKDSRELVKRNVALILAGMNQPPAASLKNPASWTDAIGFYTYPLGVSTPNSEFGKEVPAPIKAAKLHGYDRSNSQYGVLGMWALQEAGGEVPTLFWQIEDAAWKKAQLSDGGWDYAKGREGGATPSMTAAGIATLFITQDYTLEEDWKVCKGGVKNKYIEAGLHWMDQHIDMALGHGAYTMYGIERIGTASGRKYFGTKDWYAIGADNLVKHQAKDGGFGDIPNTCFSLLFLSRGRAPVLMNKLEYTTDKADKGMADVWNERPRDVANLARWVGKEDEAYLNWQVVNLKVSPEELHDAPILYISGNTTLNFSKEEEDKLRTYVEQGGMILGNADCGKEAFSKSFMALGHKLFPKYEFRQSAPNDFVYTEQFRTFRQKPKVMELSNYVRKLMILVPELDPSRSWQTRSSGTKEESFGLGANIFLYAVDKKNLMAKGETYIVKANPAIPTTKTLKVARLDVGDNADPEPGGWPRMTGVMHNVHKIDVKVDLVKPEALDGYKVANLTGTGKLSLSPASREAIKKFVDGGGTLIVDAAGGDATFADGAENELNTIFAGAKLDLLPSNHLVYNEPDSKMEKVGWRAFAVDKVADKHNPKLRGLTIGKRTAVFFSREDISAGIVGEPVDGIYGYDPTTATNLMAGMLQYAENGGAEPTTAPAAPSVAAKAQARATPAKK
jgi:hypothetical protein